MFENLFKTRAHQQRQLRSQVADLLLLRLGQERTLVLDNDLVAEFKVGRRTLMRIAYDLVIKERMHIMADAEGRVVLLANDEFRRFMLRRSGASEEVLRLAERPVPSLGADAMPADREETVVVEAVEAEAEEVVCVQTPAPPDDDFSWFTLEVKPTSAKGGKLPPKRQTLPDRARDPWSVAEGAGLD